MASSNKRSGWAIGVLLLIIIGMGAGMFGMSTYIPKLGLDLSGGTTVTLTAVTEHGQKPPDDNVEQAVSIIRQRVNALGVSEAEVTKQGQNIIVSVPGAGQKKVVQQVGQTAQLRFRQVLLAQPATAGPASSPSSSSSSSPNSTDSDTSSPPTNGRALSDALRADPADTSGGSGGSGDSSSKGGAKLSQQQLQRLKQQLQARQGQAAPETSGIDKDVLEKFKKFDCSSAASRGRLLDAGEQIVACDKQGTQKYLLGKAEVLGKTVTNAQAQLPGQNQVGGWIVVLDFDRQGTQQWADFTGRVSGEQPPRNRVGIVLDGQVVSAPTVQGPIPGGQTQIEGNFTQESANNLATILRYGSLPLKFQKNEIQHISPSLGAESLRAGLLAGGLGMILVLIYALLYYRGLGFVVASSLAIAGALAYGGVVLLGISVGYRLSLAGIAGLIVAVGITADSFVVYFERLRDEVREGRSLRSAVEHGWQRARRTIITADVVQFLAALVLWIVAVGDVKGFAFTLGLTTLLDVFVVFLFTKPMLTLLGRTRFFGGGHPLSGLDPRRLGARRRATSTPVTTRRRTRPREAS